MQTAMNTNSVFYKLFSGISLTAIVSLIFYAGSLNTRIAEMERGIQGGKSIESRVIVLDERIRTITEMINELKVDIKELRNARR